MNHKLIDLPLLVYFKDKFERKFERKFDKKLEDLNAEIDEKFGEVNANLENMLVIVSFDPEAGTLTTKSSDYQETLETQEVEQ